MDYHFRIYYLTKDTSAIRRIKERFRTTVSVNGESVFTTDAEGAGLVWETERRGFIKVRNYESRTRND